MAIARDLIHLCGTKILAGQDEKIGDELSRLVGLSAMAERLVTDWATGGKGRALWIVGSHLAKVQTIRTSWESQIVDTDGSISPVAAVEPAVDDIQDTTESPSPQGNPVDTARTAAA
ncbi:MAG: hypothetical protein J0H43_07540 [Actinobacteria bacterium]|nr:hypothetical protein [Actinomycetota bacterium]